MSMFRKSAGQPSPSPAPGDGGRAAEDSPADLSSLFNYPSLGQLFEGTDTRALAEMRARLERTNQDLERVVRQGAKEDADGAARAARAVSVTLEFLAQLEQLRRESTTR